MVDSDDSVVVLEIVVTRVIDSSGRMGFIVKTPACYNAVEILGLLEAAKQTVFRDMASYG